MTLGACVGCVGACGQILLAVFDINQDVVQFVRFNLRYIPQGGGWYYVVHNTVHNTNQHLMHQSEWTAVGYPIQWHHHQSEWTNRIAGIEFIQVITSCPYCCMHSFSIVIKTKK